MLRTLRKRGTSCSRTSATFWQTPVFSSIIDCINSAETPSIASSAQALSKRIAPGAKSPESGSSSINSSSAPTVVVGEGRKIISSAL